MFGEPTARDATLDDDLREVPLKPILDLWSALKEADPTAHFPPLGAQHVRAIALALRSYAAGHSLGTSSVK